MDKKLIYFLIGFSIFYFAYYKFVLEPMEKRNLEAQRASRQKQATERIEEPARPTPASPPVQAKPQEITPEPLIEEKAAEARRVTVDTPLYRAEFLSKGAVLTSFRLKNYTNDNNEPLQMIPQAGDVHGLPLSLEVDDSRFREAINNVNYSVSSGNLDLDASETGTLLFEYSTEKYRVRKRFEFSGDSYLFQTRIQATRDGQSLPVRVSWAPGLETLESYRKRDYLRPAQGLVNTGKEVERWEADDIEQFQKVGSTVRWAGVENNYFVAVFIPSHPADAFMMPVAGASEDSIHKVNLMVAPAGGANDLDLTLFIGPKDYVLLRELGMDLQEAVSFGFFGPIAKALFFGLRYLYKFTGNYGWAIVLLTVLIKIIFTPFTQKSFNSMKKMQQMQPELKKIQERYSKMKSDDPRKQNMNVEMMQLHKRYGVNPLGGCLPMLLQMPVLFAFYSLLSNAIELRKAPFILWLQDLSKPDPYMVTPILMGATMLWQQRLTPTTDPMQQKMMYIMPVMFTFMSFQLQSGLVLYWLFSNILSLMHQYYFQHQQKMVAVKASHA